MLEGWEDSSTFFEAPSGLYQAIYPGFQNGEDRKPLEQHFFRTLSHVIVQRPGISDILAVYAEVTPRFDLRPSELHRPPLLRIIVGDGRVRVVGSSNR
jgi:hypothetical protein